MITNKEGSMERSYAAYLEYFPWKRDEYPTFSDWILSDAEDCRVFRQGWASRRTYEVSPESLASALWNVSKLRHGLFNPREFLELCEATLREAMQKIPKG